MWTTVPILILAPVWNTPCHIVERLLSRSTIEPSTSVGASLSLAHARADTRFVESHAILLGTLRYRCPNNQSGLKKFFIGLSEAASIARSRAVAVDLANTNLGNRANGGKVGQSWQAAISMQKSKHLRHVWCHSTLRNMYCTLITAI